MRKIFLGLIFGLLFIDFAASGQTITIPTGNPNGGSQRYPLGTWFGYERYALIYTQAEIATAGSITQLAFYINSVSFPGTTICKIYLKHTASTSFSADTYANISSGATLVYDNTIASSSFIGGAWLDIPLSTTFSYNNTNNLMVIVETNTGGAGNETSSSKNVRYSTTASNLNQRWVQDNSVPTGTGSLSTFRPNIKIDFLSSPCSAPPTPGTTNSSATNICTGTSITLSVAGAITGVTGLTYQWQSSPDNSTWTNIGGATSATYGTSVATSTWFRRAITCSGETRYSTSLQVVVQTPTMGASPVSVCVNSSSNLTATASTGSGTILSQNFNSTPVGWATANNTTGGTIANAAWTLQPDGYSYTAFSTYTFHSNDNSQFYLTNSDAAGSGVSNVSTILQSPSFSTMGYSTASLQFYHHFNYLSGDINSANVEVSTNGTFWTALQSYVADEGTESSFVLATIDLTPYINNATVYIRFRYDAEWDWWWAIDNVTITGTPSSATYAWTASPSIGAGLPGSAATLSAANNSVTVTPTTTGTFTYTVTTNNSCLAPGTVTVTSTTGSLVAASACKTQTVSTGDNYFVNGACNLFAKIVPQGAVPVAGSVSTCVTIDGTVQFYQGQPYLQRHYDIEPATNPSNSTARITLYATQAEFTAVNTADALAGNNWPDFPTGPADATGISAVKVTQWHGTAAPPTSPGTYPDPYAVYMSPVLVTWNSTDLRWEIVIDIVGFSGFYIHTGFGYALPTMLTNFNGRREGNGNLLNWTVATEQNTRGYSVERSYDGIQFSAIGFVNSQSPGGNSNAALQYHFTDNNFTGDKQYYRLKQTSYDGRTSNSTVVLIKSMRSSSFIVNGIFPNPAQSVVNIMLESPVQEKLDIIVTDISGRVVARKAAVVEQGTTTIPIDVERLVAGTYFIKAVCASGCEGAVKKFIRQ